MEEISDLVKLYAAKTNKELYELNSQIGGYTENAIEAFLIVVEERGGKEYLSKEFEKFEIIENEKNSIREEVITLLKLNTSIDEINEIVESDILTMIGLNNLISETYEDYIEKKEDQNFNLKTFVLGSIGGIISCFLGVFLLRMILQQGYEIKKIVLLIFLLLNYVLISSFTKKNYKNITVIILTVLFTFLTLVFNKEFISF